jgi:putative heme iron utilization protein
MTPPATLLSDLAEHSKNIAADPRVALLIDGTAGLPDPLTGPRVTLLGEARRSADPGGRARFRPPSGRRRLRRLQGSTCTGRNRRAHLVAGFGRIHWIAGEGLRGPAAPALAAAEAGIVEHMNADHAEALDLMARVLAGRQGDGWRMTGIDTEGCDLRRGGEIARLDFAAPVRDPEAARAELIRLTQAARTMSSRGAE